MKTAACSIIGAEHAHAREKDMRFCHDYSYSYSDDAVSIIAVGDGGSVGRNRDAVQIAAKTNVNTIIGFFRDPLTWKIPKKDEFEKAVIQTLESALKNTSAKLGVPYEDMSATISSVAVRENGDYLAVSIGNGTVIAFDQLLQPKTLALSYYMGTNKTTIYTNDYEGSRKQIKVWGGTMKGSRYLAFAVFTDGADFLKHYVKEGNRMLSLAAAYTFFDKGKAYIQRCIFDVAKKETRDDISLALLCADTKEGIAAAERVLTKYGQFHSDASSDGKEQENKAPDPQQQELHKTIEQLKGRLSELTIENCNLKTEIKWQQLTEDALKGEIEQLQAMYTSAKAELERLQAKESLLNKELSKMEALLRTADGKEDALFRKQTRFLTFYPLQEPDGTAAAGKTRSAAADELALIMRILNE